MIKSLTVRKLHNKQSQSIRIDFNEDLTILTGENGCSKTTLLKILWYLISPNVERVFEEYEFERISLICDSHEIHLTNHKDEKSACLTENGKNVINITNRPTNNSDLNNRAFLRIIESLDNDPELFRRRLEEINEYLCDLDQSSLFFPTFRRVEESKIKNITRRGGDELSHTLSNISRRLSVKQHKFISYVATDDIKELIAKLHAKISNDALQERQFLLKHIREIAQSNTTNTNEAARKFLSINTLIQDSNDKQDAYFAPYNRIEECISKFIRNKSIEMSNGIIFGDSANTVKADDLSSGEKQILSFIAYNGCYANTPIIIDEPELSLGVDWQRNLMPALLEQTPSNQFIIATHSPLIYSRYPDKEVRLDV